MLTGTIKLPGEVAGNALFTVGWAWLVSVASPWPSGLACSSFPGSVLMVLAPVVDFDSVVSGMAVADVDDPVSVA